MAVTLQQIVIAFLFHEHNTVIEGKGFSPQVLVNLLLYVFQIQKNWVMDNYQARHVCKGVLLLKILYKIKVLCIEYLKQEINTTVKQIKLLKRNYI